MTDISQIVFIIEDMIQKIINKIFYIEKDVLESVTNIFKFVIDVKDILIKILLEPVNAKVSYSTINLHTEFIQKDLQ